MPQTVLPAADAVARARQGDLSLLAPMRPVLIGPKAGLHRYAVAAERAHLGAYDPVDGNTFSYPDKTSGSTVDLESVRVIAATLSLNYFNKYRGSNGSCQPSTDFPNRVRAANFVFKTGNGSDRSATFKDRDVKVGDTAVITGVDGDTVTLTTTVSGFVGEPIAASTGSATADDNNADNQILAVSVTQTTGTPINDIVATANASAYESTADGYINRTYTVTVTQASSGSDATTALLRVRSADGLDDVDGVAPAAFSSPTAIGTKGLTVTWSLDPAHSSASSFGIAESDFVVGQQWVVDVSQAFTATVATAAGTYTGPRDTGYIVTVSRGGLYAGATKPQITVTTTTGVDRSGPTSVTAASTPFAAGSYGVTVSFGGTRLRKGDVFHIDVTAAAEGALKTLVLTDDVPEGIRGTEVDLQLYATRTDVDVARVRTVPTDATNWSRDADGITTTAAWVLTDGEFTDGGDPFAVAVSAADLYAEYREWLTAGAQEIVRVATVAQAEAALGVTDDPTNPLGYAAGKALAHTANGLGIGSTTTQTTTDVVLCVALGGDPADDDLWAAALEAITEDDEAYAVVPIAPTAAAKTAVAAHVAAQSDDAVGFYRVCWLPATLAETGAVVSAATTSDHEVATGAVTTTTVVASANSKFVTNGVRAGDTYRTNYGTDAFDNETYDAYPVESVTSETTLVLGTAVATPINVAVKFEVWRAYTKAELVTQLTAEAAGYGSARVRLVWPDAPGFGGDVLTGDILCAALAGLSGSVPSHQGLRNVGLVGFDDLTRASGFFTAAQLTGLGAGGVFVAAQTTTGVPYVRAAVTTDVSTTATKEEMIIRNSDFLRKAVQSAWAPYVGAGNVVSNIQQLLDAALVTLVNGLRVTEQVIALGPPVGNITIASVSTVAGHTDVIEVVLTVTGIAVPLNQIRLVLPVTA
jgi:hypothetical protein